MVTTVNIICSWQQPVTCISMQMASLQHSLTSCCRSNNSAWSIATYEVDCRERTFTRKSKKHDTGFEWHHNTYFILVDPSLLFEDRRHVKQVTTILFNMDATQIMLASRNAAYGKGAPSNSPLKPKFLMAAICNPNPYVAVL